MENDPAGMQKKPTNFTGTTTTLPLDAKPFFASTVSDNEAKEFMDSASIFPDELRIGTMSSEDAEQFYTEWLEGLESRISEYSVSTTMNQSQRKDLTNGSTGHFPGEAEP